MVNLKQFASSSLALLSAATYAAAAAVVTPTPDVPGGPIVDLGYSRYQVQTQANGVNEWLGIRYAAPPVGKLRFRKPVAPDTNTDIIQADKFKPVCYGTGQMNNINATYDEDCLFLNIWGPSNFTENSKLPVFFWLTGGGYIRNANANYNGSELVRATNNNMVYVSINYRVGPFGFLASLDVSATDEMDLNVGLHDQLLALRWVQQNIAKFGGDPGQVVLVGDSAGAGSIAIHLVTNYTQPETLFHGIFGLSPFFPAQFHPKDLQFQFDLFAERVQCGNFSTSSQKLACLREQSGANLQAANQMKFPYPGRTSDAVVPYTPCVDNDLLTDYPLTLFTQGKYRKLPSIFGHDTNEGSLFAADASSPDQVASFFRDNFPQLDETDTTNILSNYPKENPVPLHNAWFPSASAAYGDTVLSCPALGLSSYLAPFADTWNYRYNVNTPSQVADGSDVFHQAELEPLFGEGNAFLGRGQVGQEAFSVGPILQEYYTNFVRFLDPNGPAGSVNQTWPQWKPAKLEGATGTRIVFSLDENFTPVVGTEQVPNEQLARCSFWRTLEDKMGQ